MVCVAAYIRIVLLDSTILSDLRWWTVRRGLNGGEQGKAQNGICFVSGVSRFGNCACHRSAFCLSFVIYINCACYVPLLYCGRIYILGSSCLVFVDIAIWPLLVDEYWTLAFAATVVLLGWMDDVQWRFASVRRVRGLTVAALTGDRFTLANSGTNVSTLEILVTDARSTATGQFAL